MERTTALLDLAVEARGCTRCPELVAARRRVVLGAGAGRARVLLVAEAPGPAEDAAGVPLAGRAAQLLVSLLAEAGLEEDDVHLTTAVKCRTPDNRAPSAPELDRCADWLAAQVRALRPIVVGALGHVAVRRLRGDAAPLSAVHGRDEVVTLGGVAARLLPMLHPAAALYAPATVATLRADVARIPELLALGAPDQPAAEAPEPPLGQLELF